MRIGFESDEHFSEILELINTYDVDLLSLHARTVKGGYKSEVQYEYITEAAKQLNCPVFANGNITSYLSAEKSYKNLSRGLMIGRSIETLGFWTIPILLGVTSTNLNWNVRNYIKDL